jgi:hypothetical protein
MEKKKRGRPPGSGKKDFKPTKMAIGIDTFAKENIINTLPEVTVFEKKVGDMIPFPSNWNEMGKVDRLKWLTEHRK